MNEKVAQLLQKGKEICGKCKAQVFQGYAMGNELMDKVGFLQKPLHKKIVWGAIGAIAIVSLFLLFNGGDSPESALARLAAALDEKDWIKMQGCVYGSNPTKAGRSMNAEEMKEFATSEFVKSQMESDSMKEFANTIRDAKILSVKIKDDRATMKFRPGDQETLKRMRADGATGVKIEAVKSDGVWKINMDSFDVIMK
ncbi:MAG: hypothetical protein IKJ45_10610 [Kiritimatiellae bacterium]|nr:hypothetical protein [Kiritimatiellia bacterium]